MTAPAWRWLVQPRSWEYRWRALPLFLSQGAAVAASAALTGSFAMPTSGVRPMLAVGLGVAGLFLRVWGVGLISAATMSAMTLSTDRLVRTGIYSLVRNPLYLGDLLLFAGYGLFLPPALCVAFVAFHAIRTLRLIRFEESQLAARHGREFDDYRRDVPRLLPRLAVPLPGRVEWREGLAASAIWASFAVGYVAVWLTGDVWAITPYETAGFLFAALYFSRARRSQRRVIGA